MEPRSYLGHPNAWRNGYKFLLRYMIYNLYFAISNILLL